MSRFLGNLADAAYALKNAGCTHAVMLGGRGEVVGIQHCCDIAEMWERGDAEKGVYGGHYEVTGDLRVLNHRAGHVAWIGVRK